MTARFSMKSVQPAAYQAIDAIDNYIDETKIDPLHKELIRIRASQLNGCAYCLNIHNKDARKIGETEQRLYVLSAWREARNWFTDEEQAILALTEEITLIANHGVSDEVYNRAIELFGEEKTAQLYMAIISINIWNRIGVGLKMQPK